MTTPVSAQGTWRYALYDLLTRQVIADHIPVTVDPFDQSLTEAGTLTASMPVDSDAAKAFDPWNRALPRRTSLVMIRDEVVISEYLILNRPSYQASSKVMTLSCAELRSYFDKHRILRPMDGYGSRKTLSFTQTDAFDVFRALLADAQSLTYQGHPVGDLGITADPSVMSGVLVDRRDTDDDSSAYHGYEFPYYGQLFDDLAAAVGFEWRLDSYFDETRQLRRRLLLGYPHVGRPADADSLLLEYPGTIDDYTWPEDGESSANYVAALGTGDQEALIWGEAYADGELTTGYPIYETTASYKSDTSSSIATAHAQAEVGRRQGDIVVPSIDVIGRPPCAPGDYVHARISDEARFRGSSTSPVDVWVRVISLRTTPKPVEKTTLVIENPRGV